MKTIVRTLAALVATIFVAGAAYACSATSTVDKARQSKDTDQYQAARDVAQEMIDTEGWENDQPTLESGIGTLLTEKDVYGLSVPNNGVDTSDWQSVLDKQSARGHGITTSGANVSGASCKVKDHMRMHIQEWDEALKGNNPSLMDWWNNGGYGQLASRDHAG